MSDNGSGVYNVNSTGQPVVTDTPIAAAVFNAYTADAATAMSNRIAKDGQTTVVANIPFAGYKLTGVGAATARTDAATLATIQDGTGVYSGTVGGTADAITLTPSPPITAYVAGMVLRWIASGANTTSATVAVSGLAAKALTRNGTTALRAGDIASGSMVTATYDGTRFILAASSALALSGDNLTGGLNEARGNITQHATTMDLFAVTSPSVLDGTGSAVTITAIANAPQGGARRTLYPIANTVITNGATFAVDGAANYTTAAGDKLEFESVTTSTFKVHITKKDGTPVVGGTAGQLVGTATDDNASAGNVGEYLSSSVLSSSPVAMTSGVSVNITSLSLTAGDWDVAAIVGVKGAATTTINYWIGSISTTTGTVDTTNGRRVATIMASNAFSFTALYTQTMAAARISLAATTTIYLVTEAGFGVSTCDAYGLLSARRAR